MSKYFAYCEKCDIARQVSAMNKYKCSGCKSIMQVKELKDTSSFKFELKGKK